MKKQIIIELPILPGSISSAMSKCGKRHCRCKGSKPKLHGPYYRWTGVIDGKRTTITLTKEVAKECRHRIKNYRKLLKQIDQYGKQSLKEPPWGKK